MFAKSPTKPDPKTLPPPPDGWATVHENIVTLCYYLVYNGHAADDIAHAVEKPWCWTDEFKLALWSREAEFAA